MKLYYPKMIYKTREDRIIVKNEEEQEEALKKGYVEWEVFLGIKEESKKEESKEVDIDSLSWNELRSYAKELEKNLGVEIISRGMKQSEIVEKIKWLQLNK